MYVYNINIIYAYMHFINLFKLADIEAIYLCDAAPRMYAIEIKPLIIKIISVITQTLALIHTFNTKYIIS